MLYVAKISPPEMSTSVLNVTSLRTLRAADAGSAAHTRNRKRTINVEIFGATDIFLRSPRQYRSQNHPHYGDYLLTSGVGHDASRMVAADLFPDSPDS